LKDKIFIWIDSNLLSFCTAYYLQQKYDCELFAIIDVTNKSKQFFVEQSLVKFSKIWFYHDFIKKNYNHDREYLENFEKNFQINLWELSQNERIFNSYNENYRFSSDEILSILDQECHLFEQILKEVQPNFLILDETALHHDYLFHKMCKISGVKILMLNQSKFGYKCILSEELHKLDNLENLDSIKSTDRTFEQLRNYLKSHNYSKQLLSYKNKRASSKFDKAKAALKFLSTSNTSIKTHYPYYGRTKTRVLFNEFISLIKTKIRESYINKNLTRNIINEKNILFTLHMEPERSLLLAVPYHTNQIETIRHISKALPIGYKLYVKEHFSQSIRGWRKISFYKELNDIPNVVVIHPSVSIEQLIKNSSLVISVGGTVSFEACFYEKPSIIFADLGYKIIKSITKLTNIEELPKIIRTSLQMSPQVEDLDKYVTALDQHSFEFDLWEFQLKYFDYFYYGGNYVDVEISESDMKSFLQNEKLVLENLTDQYIKKINQFKH
jgi:hypothetical protein